MLPGSVRKSQSFKNVLDKFTQRQLKENEVEDAVKWCVANKAGAKAYIAMKGSSTILKYGMLDLRLAEHKRVVVKGGQPKKAGGKKILTSLEERDLVNWLDKTNGARDGKNKAGINQKVQEILKARHHQNKKGGRGFNALSANAKAVMGGKELSQSWYVGVLSFET